jgi:hypothetical protein
MTVASVCDEDQLKMDGQTQTAEVGEAQAGKDFKVDVGAGPASSRPRLFLMSTVISPLPAAMLSECVWPRSTTPKARVLRSMFFGFC